MMKINLKNAFKTSKIFGVLSIFVTLSFLQTIAHASTNDTAKLVQKAYSATKTLQSEFTQETYVETLNRKIKNRGTLYLDRPGKMRIEYKVAPARTYVSDGKKLWIASEGNRQVQSETLGKSGVPNEALAFLKGFANLHEQFKVENGKGRQLLLYPKQKSWFKFLDCKFERNGLLSTMIVHNVSGGQAVYNFKNSKQNIDLSADLFKKPKPHK